MIALEHKESIQHNHEAAVDPTLCSESAASAKEFQKISPYSRGFASWSNLQPDLKYVPYCQLNALGPKFCPFPVDTHFQYARFPPQRYTYEYQLQDFQYFVVIDFEATCDKGWNPHPQEIIEFPSVIVSSLTGQLEACFQTYVRPTCNQHLSEFCKDLTGIQQIQVDRGVTLSEALLSHDKWLENKGIKSTNFAVVTWSNWDCRVMLESECRYKNIRKPSYFDRWINLKVPFQTLYGEGRYNLKEAVEMAGLMWLGRPHCGLDDAKNTARLLALLMHKGFKFYITDSMEHKHPQNLKVQQNNPPIFEFYPRCYCGVKSSKCMVRKPGPKQGSCFFSCGNWTPTRGNLCRFFQWASP